MTSTEKDESDGGSSFDADIDAGEEAEVLNWLLEDKEVAKAIDVYLQGSDSNEAAAVPLLLHAVDRICPPPSKKRPPPPRGEEVPTQPPTGQQHTEQQLESASRKRARVAPTAALQTATVAGASAAAKVGGAAVDAVAAAAAATAVAEAPADQQSRPSQAESRNSDGDDWLVQCRLALDVERAKDKARLDEKRQELQNEEQQEQGTRHRGPVPLYWKLDLPGVSKTLTQRGILPASLTPAENPHTTLLYFGGTTVDEVAAKRSGIPLEQFQGMREALEALEGEEFEIRMLRIIVEDSVACAVVSLPPVLPCSNKIPHITLGTKPGVPPRYANEVLEEMQAGRKEGINVIELQNPRPLRGRVALECSEPDAV